MAEIDPEMREMIKLADKEINILINMSRIQRKHEHNK